MPNDTRTELDEARGHYRSTVIPAEALAIMDAETERLRATGLYDANRWLGTKAEDFILPDAQGNPVRLFDLLQSGPVILAFYRGAWCPYCSIALRGLQRQLQRLRALGAHLVAVSPQLPDGSLTTAERNSLAFPVLSDVRNNVARQFGLVFELSASLSDLYRGFGHPLEVVNGPEGARELPVPGTFVILTDGTIDYAFVDPDYTRRVEPADIVNRLAAVQSMEGVR